MACISNTPALVMAPVGARRGGRLICSGLAMGGDLVEEREGLEVLMSETYRLSG